MRFATTRGERSPEELAASIFGTELGDPLTTRAANALVRANPPLKGINELPPTLVTVPNVRGTEPAAGTQALPAAAARLLLSAVLEHADEVGAAAKELADEGVAASREHRKSLGAADVKRRARDDKRYAAWLKEAEAEAKVEVDEARELAREQKTATAELMADLEALLAVLER